MADWHGLADRSWRMAVPAGMAIAGLALMTAPLFTPVPVIPNFAFLILFIWRVFQPALMPVWIALPIGVIADLWLALPLGIHATLLPLFVLLIGVVERRLGQRPFGFDWILANLFIAAYYLLFWQLAVFTGAELHLESLLAQMLTTMSAYPPVAWICARLQRRWIDVP